MWKVTARNSHAQMCFLLCRIGVREMLQDKDQTRSEGCGDAPPGTEMWQLNMLVAGRKWTLGERLLWLPNTHHADRKTEPRALACSDWKTSGSSFLQVARTERQATLRRLFHKFSQALTRTHLPDKRLCHFLHFPWELYVEKKGEKDQINPHRKIKLSHPARLTTLYYSSDSSENNVHTDCFKG